MTDFFYTSRDHKKRWLTAILTTGKVVDGKLDPEYASALYILTSGTGIWYKAKAYVDRDGIDFEALLQEEDFSSGQRVMMQLAWNLFNSGTMLSPVELTHIDSENFTVAMNAFQIRRVNWSLREIASDAEISNIREDIRDHIIASSDEKPWLPLNPLSGE
jgi:hypothetical protein